ncbi:MAG: hypothetical protein V1859_05205 [archaeon]
MIKKKIKITDKITSLLFNLTLISYYLYSLIFTDREFLRNNGAFILILDFACITILAMSINDNSLDVLKKYKRPIASIITLSLTIAAFFIIKYQLVIFFLSSILIKMLTYTKIERENEIYTGIVCLVFSALIAVILLAPVIFLGLSFFQLIGSIDGNTLYPLTIQDANIAMWGVTYFTFLSIFQIKNIKIK